MKALLDDKTQAHIVSKNVVEDTFIMRLARAYMRYVAFEHAMRFNGDVVIQPIYNTKVQINIASIIVINKAKYISCGAAPRSTDSETRFILLPTSNLAEKLTPAWITAATKYYVKNKEYIATRVSPQEVIQAVAATLVILLDYKDRVFPSNSDTKFYKEFVKFVPAREKINHLEFNIFQSFPYYNVHHTVTKLSTKITPINIYGIYQLGSLSQRPWVELFIYNRINCLNRSFICDGFPYLYSCSIVYLDDLHVFSNVATIEKYLKSEFYMRRIKTLKRDAIEKKQKTGGDEAGDAFDDKALALIEFAEKNMIFSDYATILFMENVGTSLYDLLMMIKLHKQHHTKINCIQDLTLFHSVAFQMLYNFLVLNVKIGAIHGDMHLNNVTYMPEPSGGISCYVIDGQQFFIDSTLALFIIDFGRSILRDLTPEVQSVHTKKLLNYMYKTMPEFYIANKDAIERISKSNYTAFFHIASGLDIINFFRNFRFTNIEGISAEIANLCFDIEMFVQDYIKKELLVFYQDDKWWDVEKMDWIALTTIKKFHVGQKFQKSLYKVINFDGVEEPTKNTSIKESILNKIKKQQIKQYNEFFRNN